LLLVSSRDSLYLIVAFRQYQYIQATFTNPNLSYCAPNPALVPRS